MRAQEGAAEDAESATEKTERGTGDFGENTPGSAEAVHRRRRRERAGVGGESAPGTPERATIDGKENAPGTAKKATRHGGESVLEI
jgi:hypothetical protein